MHRKNVFVLLFSIVFMAIWCDSSLATTVTWAYPELELAQPLIGPHTQLPPATSAIPYTQPTEPKGDPLGQTFLLGTTWYDYQSNGTCEKMIDLTDSRGVHFCWMNGLQALATDRHIYYNYFTPDGSVNWPDVGYQVDQGNRAGYTCCSSLSEGEAMIAYHFMLTATSDWNTQVAYDFMEGFGAFQTTDLDNLAGWDELIWPKATVCSQNYIHVVSCEAKDVVWQRIAYARSEDGGATFTPFTVVDTIVSISQQVAASPVSNKVGIAYTQSEFSFAQLTGPPYSGYLVSQTNNGVTLIESEDGVTWDFSAKQDITNLVNPDTSRYPDTTWANGDTLRAYSDVSLLYDQNDYAHVAFTTRGFWFDAWLDAQPDSFAVVGITLDASVIWHWSEEHDTLTVVADGWYTPGDTSLTAGPGAWRSTVDRPSLGQDPETGYLYCVYVKCPEGDTSGGPIPSHGWCNGEIYCAVSTDGGLNWSEGTNLTNTPSEDAQPGNCMDEDYPSLTGVVNDTLHLIYVEDKDAGGVVQTNPQEGTWTENPVKYQKVPADLVPPGPPYVPNFNFHVVPSTAVEEPTLVDGTVPVRYSLSQNYPNPFNPETTIRFNLPQSGPVSLRIYNVTGQLVRQLSEGHREAGAYEIRWDGRNEDGHLLPSGIYFCRMKAGEFVATRKMALIK